MAECNNKAGGLEWVKAWNGNVPEGAVPVSDAGKGETLFIARAWYEGNLLPGKLHPSHRVCYVGWNVEHAKHEYEVLVNRHGCSLSWVGASGGAVPHGAVEGGISACGEKLFVGRGNYYGDLIPGKVQPRHKTLYYPYGGKDIGCQDYEVLVINN